MTDTIIKTLYELKNEYDNNGVFDLDSRQYTFDEMISEIEKQTDAGKQFEKMVKEKIRIYMSKFKGAQELTEAVIGTEG